MIHLKWLVAGMVAVAFMFLLAAGLCGALTLATMLTAHILGNPIYLSGMGIVNPISLVLFGFLVCYVVGHSVCKKDWWGFWANAEEELDA